MPTLTQKQRPTIVENYDVAADAKKRISLRSAKTKYFHVKELSNGCFYLEPRVLVSPQAISARSLKMLDKSAVNLNKALTNKKEKFDSHCIICKRPCFAPKGNYNAKSVTLCPSKKCRTQRQTELQKERRKQKKMKSIENSSETKTFDFD
jgi:hypothetical protein